MGEILSVALALIMAAPVWSATPDQDVQALGSATPHERKEAQERLIQMPNEAIPALVRGLDSSSQQVKTTSLWLLRQIRARLKAYNDDPVATSIGTKAVHEKDPAVRMNMVLALRDLHGNAAVHELKRFASDDSDESVRVTALHHVANVSDQDESKFFKQRLGDPSKAVRLAAYIELAKKGDSSGRELALKTIQESSSVTERSEAFDMLGVIGNPADAAVLRKYSESKDENFHSRYIAFRALRHHQLVQIAPKDRLAYLIKALDDPSEDVRKWAYIELYHSPDPNTNVALKKYLAEKGHVGYTEAANALSVR